MPKMNVSKEEQVFAVDNTSNDFVAYRENSDFGGAEQVVRKESEYLDHRKASLQDTHKLTALALSGGGIRSATFGLGVLQSLARRGLLDKIDYLSTVSGGGYIGSSLTWFLHQALSGNGNPQFDTSEDNFPFGTHRRGKLKDKDVSTPNVEDPEVGGGSDKVSVLRHLRQNGKYLAPGCGLTIFSLLSVLLRGAFLGLLVFLPILILVFLVLHAALILRPLDEYPHFLSWAFQWQVGANGNSITLNGALVLAVFIAILGCSFSVIYSRLTYSDGTGITGHYVNRRRFEIYAGRLLISILALLILGSLPYLEKVLSEAVATQASFFSTIFGLLGSIAIFLKSGSSNGQAKMRVSLLVWLAAGLLFYGIFLLSYLLAKSVIHGDSISSWGIFVFFLVVACWVGRYTNLNYVSIHRYYRDRLMETYLPNISSALEGSTGCQAERMLADRAPLSKMYNPEKGIGPYHIINTNIVLVASDIKKFRGRGGDNFILTPAYCGSNATGWLSTHLFMNNQMTLATAMAISGAAANSDTGIGGDGPTRNPILSILMSLLNFRLGYWVPNPNPEINPWQLPKCQKKSHQKSKGLVSSINPLHGYRPNFFVPTLTATALGRSIGQLIHRLSSKVAKRLVISEKSFGKNEKNRFLELTDGGHFENLGLYELVRRKLPRIIVCDAASDPDYEFTDLANAIEKVRVDFGALINLDIKPLIPSKRIKSGCGIACAEKACVKGKINYADNTVGEIYYIKTTFFKDLHVDLFSYKKTHRAFPDETTADQFFDEKQFEAYRELGYAAAELLPDY